MAREKAASSISVKDFDSNTDDFDEWIELFEDSVVLATNPQTTARRHELYLKWLKQKLDAPARAVLKQIPAGTAYASVGDVKGVKEQLQELLIDPHAVYKWQAMKTKITWDQKESFQELATRVKRAVDKYDKDDREPALGLKQRTISSFSLNPIGDIMSQAELRVYI